MTTSTAPPPAPPLFHQPSSPSFSAVPDEIVANCLARISKTHYRSLSSVSKSFHSLLSSPEIYAARSQIGATEPRLYLCLRLNTATRLRWFTLRTPDQTLISNGGKSIRNSGVIVNEGGIEINSGLSLVPVKISSSYACAHLNAAIVAVGSEIYQIGGSDDKDKRSRVVRVLDCRSHTWRVAPNMTVARSRPKAFVLDGKIYVLGGCGKTEEPMNWGEVFDIKTQTWKGEPLPSPSGVESGRNFKVVVFGASLYVITEHKKYAFDPKEGKWLLDMGFVVLRCLVNTSKHWLVIENLLFNHNCDKLWWYDLSCEKWLMVEGLTDLYDRDRDYRKLRLVNYGGKLVMVWQESTALLDRYPSHRFRIYEKRTWVVVIRLEKRGTAIWGEIERLNSFVPGPYKLLACLSVSL